MFCLKKKNMFLLELRPAGRRLTVPENKAVRRIFYSQER
jgi:hypothetical protein